MKNKTYKLAKLERNRISILTDDLTHCYICGKTKQHIHEVFFGRNRQNSMKYGCCIPICLYCHQMIHNNIELDSKIKKEMQIRFGEIYDEDFISIFKKNYL